MERKSVTILIVPAALTLLGLIFRIEPLVALGLALGAMLLALSFYRNMG